MTETISRPQRDPESGQVLKKNSLALKHGAHSFLKTGRVPSIRGKRRIQKQLNEMRSALKEVVSNSEDPRKQVLIGQIIRAEGFLVLIEEYCKRAGILRPDKWRRGIAELHPVLGSSVISFMNSQRAAILALGMEPKEVQPVLAPFEIVDKEKDLGHNNST